MLRLPAFSAATTGEDAGNSTSLSEACLMDEEKGRSFLRSKYPLVGYTTCLGSECCKMIESV